VTEGALKVDTFFMLNTGVILDERTSATAQKKGSV